jgi:quercetin dioxygenase-like cupin family protein
MSAFAELCQLEPLQIWDGVVGRVVGGDHLTLAVVELRADTVIPEHSHENEQVGVLVGGSLTFRIGEEERELKPGGAWAIHANVPHEIRTGPDGAVVIETFAPRRKDWDALKRLETVPPRWPDSTS